MGGCPGDWKKKEASALGVDSIGKPKIPKLKVVEKLYQANAAILQVECLLSCLLGSPLPSL